MLVKQKAYKFERTHGTCYRSLVAIVPNFSLESSFFERPLFLPAQGVSRLRTMTINMKTIQSVKHKTNKKCKSVQDEIIKCFSVKDGTKELPFSERQDQETFSHPKDKTRKCQTAKNRTRKIPFMEEETTKEE